MISNVMCWFQGLEMCCYSMHLILSKAKTPRTSYNAKIDSDSWFWEALEKDFKSSTEITRWVPMAQIMANILWLPTRSKCCLVKHWCTIQQHGKIITYPNLPAKKFHNDHPAKHSPYLMLLDSNQLEHQQSNESCMCPLVEFEIKSRSNQIHNEYTTYDRLHKWHTPHSVSPQVCYNENWLLNCA